VDVSPAGGGDIYSDEFNYSFSHPPYSYPENFSTEPEYTLTAVPNAAAGYKFSYWEVETITVACTGETISTHTSTLNPITVNIEVDSQYVTAHFSQTGEPPPVIDDGGDDTGDGDGDDGVDNPDDDGTQDPNDEVNETPALFFPHVYAESPWETVIAMINTNPAQSVSGKLRAFSDAGELIETKSVTLAPHERDEFNVVQDFTNPFVSDADIGYVIFYSEDTGLRGYTQYSQAGLYRTAIPAATEVNTQNIYIPHIASNDRFWTGVSLLNTTSEARNPVITFNNGRNAVIALNAGEHKSFTISSLFNGSQPDIKSAVISNADGILGLEIFGGQYHMDGILLTDDTTATLYYPHVADMKSWWTGIVAYNPSITSAQLTITPYSKTGEMLARSYLIVGGKDKYIGVVRSLNLPDQTAWFKINATQPLVGFELFSTLDNTKLAAYAEMNGAGSKQGVFPKIESDGWTGIAFVNAEGSEASVTLTAYTNEGTPLAVRNITVGSLSKEVGLAKNIFAPQNISMAGYIAYTSDKNVVGFQLTASSDGTLLDGLPALH
jgi:hypothetical protein